MVDGASQSKAQTRRGSVCPSDWGGGPLTTSKPSPRPNPLRTRRPGKASRTRYPAEFGRTVRGHGRYTLITAMFSSTPLRALIAVLVTVGMQLCCCSTAWFGCAACTNGAGASLATGAHGGHDDLVASHDHDPMTGHDHGVSKSVPHDDGSPCGGHDGKPDKGKCTCSTQDPKSRASEPSKVDLPTPVLVAVLPTWDPIPPSPVGFRSLSLLERPLVRPATSLLHQHCALIV